MKLITINHIEMLLIMMWLMIGSSVHAEDSNRASKVGEYWSKHRSSHNISTSWWQSPLIVHETYRRVSGNETMTFPEFFKKQIVEKKRGGKPFSRALSLGSGHGQFEREVIRLDVVDFLLGVDLAEARVQAANDAVPENLKSRLRFEMRDLEVWRPKPEEKFDLIILKMAFHHIERLEFFAEVFENILTDDGMIYFDEYVGPKQFQFAQFDIDTCNEILESLPHALQLERNNKEHRVGRPNIEKFLKIDPSEAIRSDEMMPILEGKFDVVGKYPYGGNIFAWLFSRILFRFDNHPDIVRDILAKEWALIQSGKMQSHYVLAFLVKKKKGK